MLVVVVDVVCPDWSGMTGFHDRLRGCPASWIERDAIAWSPMLEICMVRLGAWFTCSKFMLALTWCAVVRRVEPSVWTAIFVWEQSTLLLRAWVKRSEERRVGNECGDVLDRNQ